MIQLIKSEIRYFLIVFSAPIFLTIIFQIMEFYTLKAMVNFGKTENINLWGGYYAFIILFSVFQILEKRIKEKRERFFALLPFSNKQLAHGRFWFVVIPFAIFLLYFVLIQSIVSNLFHVELSIPLTQIGIIFILFSGFIRARDDWFSHWNFGKRIQAAFVSVLIIQVLVVAVFLNLPDAAKTSKPIIGDYAEIIFFLLGLTIMVTTIFSYIKRKSYLS